MHGPELLQPLGVLQGRPGQRREAGQGLAPVDVEADVLAGDAAHVNNPIGGLGRNCGIHDAVELARCLERYCGGEGGESALDLYDRRRRTVNIEFVQSQTVANKKRLEEKDPAVRAKSFDELKATAADPVRHRAFLLRTSLIDSVRRAALIR